MKWWNITICQFVRQCVV